MSGSTPVKVETDKRIALVRVLDSIKSMGVKPKGAKLTNFLWKKAEYTYVETAEMEDAAFQNIAILAANKVNPKDLMAVLSSIEQLLDCGTVWLLLKLPDLMHFKPYPMERTAFILGGVTRKFHSICGQIFHKRCDGENGRTATKGILKVSQFLELMSWLARYGKAMKARNALGPPRKTGTVAEIAEYLRTSDPPMLTTAEKSAVKVSTSKRQSRKKADKPPEKSQSTVSDCPSEEGESEPETAETAEKEESRKTKKPATSKKQDAPKQTTIIVR
ncbi:hypothetical protein HDU80_003806, partial [Chytriomyces hyalinus]